MWTIEEARRTYNIANWSEGYFDINVSGNVVAYPKRDKNGCAVDLHQLLEKVEAAGLTTPVLLRFGDILGDRVHSLCSAFDQATRDQRYAGRFTALYPIKVNQQSSVVNGLLRHGDERIGLEAGSKPELSAVLALVPAGGVVVCNGYKDREYVRLALIGRQLGLRVYIVLEKLSELDLVLEESSDLGVQPLLGIRVRLAAIASGKWQNTGGEKAKFGLSAAQCIEVVHRLRSANRLDSLSMLHVHMGSQIANIRDIQRGMQETARFYAELRGLGAPVDCVDVGGGLGVDYEGTRTRSEYSINYSMQEYANDVVLALWTICETHGLPQPGIMTECGRALTAHHAVLVTNVVDTEPAAEHAEPARPGDDAPMILRNMWRNLEGVTSRAAMESYHDALHWWSEACGLYIHGGLDLQQRAHAEQMYYATCHKVRALLHPEKIAHRQALDELEEKLSDRYFCNFSLFQSMPDVWAIDQIFPIVPLHRLHEEPTRHAVIRDLTCDSDGRIDSYVDREGVGSILRLHSPRPGEPYLIGIFLLGAYQETLGDIHNLFGDSNSVDVVLTEDDGYRLEKPCQGDTVAQVLQSVQHDPEEILRAYEDKLRNTPLSAATRQRYLRELESGLQGYTYLE